MITYHTHHNPIISPSPWPLYIRIGSFNFFISLLLFFKQNNYLTFFTSTFLFRLTAICWWIDHRIEVNLQGKTTYTFENGVKISILLFICSEIIFFFSFFWAYFHFSLSLALELGLNWPPTLIQSFSFLEVPFINTIILLSSGVTVTLAHFYLNYGLKKLFNTFLLRTVILGIIFRFFQWREYKNSFFCIRDSTFGTSFFMLTGFHGIHVLIGTIFLLTNLIRSFLFSSSFKNYLRFELASWYWHFVDVVWIFLYFFLYYLYNWQ